MREATLTRSIPDRRCRSLGYFPAIVGAGALVVVVLGFSSCSRSSQAAHSPTSQAKVEVGVITAARKNLVRTIALPGTLVAFNQATLYGKVAGYLRSIRADKGDWVHRGQVLAVLEVPEMVDAVDQARAVYQQALADVSRAKAQADLQSITYQRFREVHSKDPDAVANQELAEYRSKFEVAEADVKLAEARVATAQANLNRSIALNQYASITAPFSGIITARYVDPGALIQAATSTMQGQPIVTLQELDTIRVYVSVPEVNVPSIRIGTPASLTTAAYPGRLFRASVTRFAEALDPATRTMKTEIDYHNPQHVLRPGMYAVVTLEIEKLKNVLVIPANALVLEGSKTSVWVVRDGTSHRLQVEAGLDNGAQVEIRSGLRGGEQVVVSGTGGLSEGTPVQASASSGEF